MKTLRGLAGDLRSMADHLDRSLTDHFLPTGHTTIGEALAKLRLLTDETVNVSLNVWDYAEGRSEKREIKWTAIAFRDGDCIQEHGPTLEDAVMAVASRFNPPKKVPSEDVVIVADAAIQAITAPAL